MPKCCQLCQRRQDEKHHRSSCKWWRSNNLHVLAHVCLGCLFSRQLPELSTWDLVTIFPAPACFFLPTLSSVHSPHCFHSFPSKFCSIFLFSSVFCTILFLFFFFPLLPVSVKSFKLAVFPNSSQLFSSELHSSLFSAKATENSSFSCFSSLVLNYSWQLCNYRKKKFL